MKKLIITLALLIASTNLCAAEECKPVNPIFLQLEMTKAALSAEMKDSFQFVDAARCYAKQALTDEKLFDAYTSWVALSKPTWAYIAKQMLDAEIQKKALFGKK